MKLAREGTLSKPGEGVGFFFFLVKWEPLEDFKQESDVT